MHAHSITELRGTIDFATETWPEYITHNSVLADNWTYSASGSAFLTPGSTHQVFGSSSFSIKPAFVHSTISLSFFNFTNLYGDLRECNVYLLADQVELSFTEENINPFGFFYSTLILDIPNNTEELKIGALTTTFCALTLSSITISERKEANDLDNDGIEDADDNCPIFPNSEQIDSNYDDIGDSCSFDPSNYVGNSLPQQCSHSSDPNFNIEPDNDGDGIIDICDPDDDNDGINDLDEIRLNMDIFTAFDFDEGKRADPDNDQIFTNDEIKLGFNPNHPNSPPMIKLGKYLLNHDHSQKVFTPHQGSIFHYDAIDNLSFSFGQNAVSDRFNLENELLLTGTIIKNDHIVFDDITFEPAIRIFPSPTLINYLYEDEYPIEVRRLNSDTNERETIAATLHVRSKIYLTVDEKLLTYEYSYIIYKLNSQEVLITKSPQLMTWNEAEGFIGIGLPSDLNEVSKYATQENETIEDKSIEDKNTTAIGYFHFYWYIALIYLLRLRRGNLQGE